MVVVVMNDRPPGASIHGFWSVERVVDRTGVQRIDIMSPSGLHCEVIDLCDNGVATVHMME
jgi:hypothetical protein